MRHFPGNIAILLTLLAAAVGAPAGLAAQEAGAWTPRVRVAADERYGTAQNETVGESVRNASARREGVDAAANSTGMTALERVPQLRAPRTVASIASANSRPLPEAQVPLVESTVASPPPPGFPVAPARGSEPGEGVRLGAFTLYGEMTESAAHTSRRDADTGAAQGLRLAPDLRLVSNWSRHELAFTLNGSATAWTKDGAEAEGTAGVALRLDARRHLRLRLGASHTIAETRIGSGTFQHDANGAVAVEYERNRLRLSALAGGTRHLEPDAEAEDYTAPRALLHGRLRLTPVLAVYGTLGADARLHDDKRDASGAKRDSTGVRLELGVEWLRGPILEGRLGLRAEARDYDRPDLDKFAGVGINGLVTWRPRRGSTVELEAGFGLTDDGGANPAREQTLALSVQQVLRRGLDWRGRAEARTTDVRAGNDRLALRLETSLAWRIRRRLWIAGEYAFEKEFEEHTPDQKPIHTLFVGLRQRF